MLDKIRSVTRLESGRLDAPYMPRFKTPYITGGNIELPDSNFTEVRKLKFDVDVELIAVACDTDKDEVKDNWEVFIGSSNENIFKTVPFKKYPEGLYLMVAHLIPKETEIKFIFHNKSSVKKFVQYRFQFLMGSDSYKSLPTTPDFPPVVHINSLSPTICYEDLPKDGMIKLTGHATDDYGLANYTIAINGKDAIVETFSTLPKKEGFSYELFVRVPPIPDKPKVDVVFVFDTSASMVNDIQNAKNNLSHFIKVLSEKRIDLYMGDLNSNHILPSRQSLKPAANFSFSANVDAGGWEGLKWDQFTHPQKGGAAFFPEFRTGSKRFFIFLTDTFIRVPYTSDIAQLFNAQNASVSVIHRGIHSDYDQLVAATKGVNGDLENPSFSSELKRITDSIIESVIDTTPHEVLFKVTAEDELGQIGEKEIKLTFKYCNLT